jgi:hypothetical protein
VYPYLDHFILQIVDYALTILMAIPENNQLVYVAESLLDLGIKRQAEKLVYYCHFYDLLTHYYTNNIV